MNNNGLALIVGGLVVIVAFLYFGTPIFRGGDAGRDIDVNIETPAPAPAN